MQEKILFVDDEVNVLEAFKRQLRKRFRFDTALGPEEGLLAVSRNGPYAVVVSDLKMPKMNGVEFLARVKEMVPETVRIMLTGHGDLQNAMEAVNQGNIFRFLTKPCPVDSLSKALEAGLEQYRLIRAEKDLLDNTLKGAVKMLTDLLAISNPEAFGRSSRVKEVAHDIGEIMGVEDTWQLETAALLSHMGFITIPEETLRKIYEGNSLTDEEQQLFHMHPMIASDLIKNVPRMEEVASIIAYQEKHFDGSGIPPHGPKGEDIPLGARILKVALDFDSLKNKGLDQAEIVSTLKARDGYYDPKVISALEKVLGLEAKYELRRLRVGEFRSGMIIAEDIVTVEGRLLIAKGLEVSPALVGRLMNFARVSTIKEPIKVLVKVGR